jgi:phage protein D
MSKDNKRKRKLKRREKEIKEKLEAKRRFHQKKREHEEAARAREAELDREAKELARVTKVAEGQDQRKLILDVPKRKFDKSAWSSGPKTPPTQVPPKKTGFDKSAWIAR